MSDALTTRTADPMDRLAHDANDPNPCPPLTAGEYEALKQSIADNGLTVPVLISAGPACEGQVIDGFHRSRICAELGIVPATYAISCATDLEFRIRQIHTNLERRQLSTAQRAMLGARLLPLLEEQARERMLAGRAEPPSTSGQGSESGRAMDLAAKAAGISRGTLHQMRSVLESDRAAELVEQIEAGQKSVKRAYEALRSSVEQAALDATISSEAVALAEIEETVALMSTEELAEIHDVSRERAAGDAVRMAVELDRHVREHGLTDQDILDYRNRPHTFTGTARRLADWLDLAATALELNR